LRWSSSVRSRRTSGS